MMRTPVLLAMIFMVLAATGLRYWQVNPTDRKGPGTTFQMHAQGTSLPATCTVGEQFFKTNETAGENLYGCTSTDTWTKLGVAGTGASIPTGTVAYFNLSGCPTGWAEYTALRGKYAVGLVSGGTLEGGSGTALSNQESRTAGQHNHTATQASHNHTITTSAGTHSHDATVTDPGHDHAIYGSGSVTAGTGGTAAMNNLSASTASADTGISVGIGNASSNVTASASSTTPSISVANTGSVAGTPAPYLQLLSCRKN